MKCIDMQRKVMFAKPLFWDGVGDGGQFPNNVIG